MLKRLLFCAAVAGVALGGSLNAQQPPTPPIKRTILQKADVPGTNLEVVLGMAEISANANVGRHTHPGPEEGTVTEGELILMIEGEPERSNKVGDSYQVPTGTIHDAKTGGGKPAKVIAVYVVPKGQPLATPAK
jgi:quercetin dioxygenase-like cupin family protein